MRTAGAVRRYPFNRCRGRNVIFGAIQTAQRVQHAAENRDLLLLAASLVRFQACKHGFSVHVLLIVVGSSARSGIGSSAT